jgi:LysR family glycine cleavage system transcriptional activator
MVSSIRMLPLNALRSFDAAARWLSFAAAAHELGVTPAAISIQVRRLEEWVGCPLFVRGHRSLALSSAGQRLAPRLTALFLEMERLVSDVRDLDATTLQVSAMGSFASKWLAPRLGRFVADHPLVQVRVTNADQRADFDRDGVDVGLRYSADEHDQLHADLIARARAFPVCSPALAERYSDPSRIPRRLLLHDESALIAPGLPTWSTWFSAGGFASLPEGTGPWFSNSHMALSAAISGQGFALGLAPLVDDDLEAGRLVKPFDLEIESSFGFWFVCRADRLNERKIAAFRAWILSQASKENSLPEA